MNHYIKQAKGFFTNLKLYWNHPPYGKQIPYKEVAAYGMGGAGKYLVQMLAMAMGLNVGSQLIALTIEIQPTHIQLISMLMTMINFIIIPVRSQIIDNTRTKYGKLRPYLILMAIPTVIISIVFVYMPYEAMDGQYTKKLIIVTVFCALLNIVSPFYTMAYDNLIFLMSSNSQERTSVISVSSIILSLAPTITGLIVPMLSEYTGGLTDIRTYRYIYPPLVIVGVILSFWVFAGTNERIVEAKTHDIKIRFFDAFRQIAKNKYFWIVNVAVWIGFLEGASGTVFGWTFIYGTKSMTQYGLFMTLVGNSALWGMLFTPWVMQKIGKRKLVVGSNILNIVFLAGLWLTYGKVFPMFIMVYLNGVLTAVATMYTRSFNADMRDYQHYISGERIDGLFDTVGLLGGLIGMATGMVTPLIYESMGLKDDYSILYDAATRESLSMVLILASVLGAALNLIPYFFYDLTEEKHKGIVKVLKIRALFEDYGNNALTDEKLAEAVELVNDSLALHQQNDEVITHEAIHSAKKMPRRSKNEKQMRKTAIREAKRAQVEQKKLNADIQFSQLVVDELNRFNNPIARQQLRVAEEIYNAGLEALMTADKSLIREARALPKGSKNDHQIKDFRKESIRQAKDRVKSAKQIRKKYKNGITEPEFDLKKAREELKQNPDKQHKKELQHAADEYALFKRVARPWVQARRMITQAENYKYYDDIAAQYGEVKRRIDDNAYLAEEQRKLEEKEQQEYLEQLQNNS